MLDGRIDLDEYGPPMAIDFTDGIDPGLLWQHSNRPVDDPSDLGAELSMACTATDLFLAVRVRDETVLTSTTTPIHLVNAIKVSLDGDRVANDFDKPAGKTGRASREGFQVLVDATGRSYAHGLARTDYKRGPGVARGATSSSCASRWPRSTPATGPSGPRRAGSVLRFNLAVFDHDQANDGMGRIAILWNGNPGRTVWEQGESGWRVDLLLALPVRYELVSGPPGATIDPETGALTWKVAESSQAAKFAVRRDPARPEIADEASFRSSRESQDGMRHVRLLQPRHLLGGELDRRARRPRLPGGAAWWRRRSAT